MSAVVVPVDDERRIGQVRSAGSVAVTRLDGAGEVVDAVLGDSFGTVLRAFRVRAGMTLQAVASRVGCSSGHVANLEAGRVRPSVLLAHRLDHGLAAGGRLVTLISEGTPVPAPPVFVADGAEITSLTVAADSPRVDLVLPVSLVTLEAACAADPCETAASVEAMSDDELRAWAVGQLLIAGITAAGAQPDAAASEAQPGPERAYRDVIRRRLPLVFGLDHAEHAGTAA